jgi:hypothetical protein
MPKTYFKSGAESTTNTPGESNAETAPVDITTQQLIDSIVYLFDKDASTPPDDFVDDLNKLIGLKNFFASDPQKRVEDLEFLVKVLDINSQVEITDEYAHLRPIRNLLLAAEKRPLANLALTSELREAEKALSSRITNIDNQLNALFPAVRPKPNLKLDISLTKAHVHIR